VVKTVVMKAMAMRVGRLGTDMLKIDGRKKEEEELWRERGRIYTWPEDGNTLAGGSGGS